MKAKSVESAESPIILLDLNYTLVSNSHVKLSPFIRQIHQELYRKWLVDLVCTHTVILMTARPDKYLFATLTRIKAVTGWQPQEACFNTHGLPPASAKKLALETIVFPQYGESRPMGAGGWGERYLAIESNPITAGMYAKFGIRSLRADDRKELERILA